MQRHSGVDWRWFQLGLISQITRVRVSPPQLNSGEMEKKVDAIFSDTLIGILDELNHAKVQREDVVNIF